MGKLLNLSDDGQKNLNHAVCACVISNLSLFLPFVVIVQTMVTLLDPLMNGGALDTNKLWFLLAGGVVSALLYLCAYYNEYLKTYKTAYTESEKIRIDVAEHLRRLPLSFFNNKDLSELTTNIMGDCTSIEHTMS
ncbi:MAG: ABC transporter ATP-binding protein, partial [Treponema sp.]|nr:ABC transporter ATP-binding protein [Treponema sp.]